MERYSHSESYKSAGVDITAGYRAVELMKGSIARTMTPGVVSGIGGFGGLFEPEFAGMERPVLVSGTDGVGTKLKLAFLLNKHDTIGIDAVAMCANDVLCAGAKPLFFLDYIACGKNRPEVIAEIVSGVAEGCVQAGAALIGGETAEHPGLMPEDEYDLAGFCVGIADAKKILNKETLRPGDVLIGLPSSGAHSNAFSLIRKVFQLEEGGDLSRFDEELGAPLLQTLLTPTRIYARAMNALLGKVELRGASHITGGGFYENIPRMLPGGLRARVKLSSFPKPKIFGLIQKTGGIPERDMYNTFNMGLGMVLAVKKGEEKLAMELLEAAGEPAYLIGEAEEGEGGVALW
ncbi:MAG: phosphoribosylformylglycinamidine cyclo-ligase [Christensenellaceae bacterium]|jgi:phosphoribosylformylglycinamidine cyclo-ligase|nr:phosphoribosylformylglycinamidine cyclo-ligase [Christensenellaceae bacterium]